MKRKKVLKCAVLALLLLLMVSGIGFYVYTKDYYRAEPQGYTATEETEDYLVYGGRDSTYGLIFYPGAKVEECAYGPLLSKLAQEGVCCVAVKMPFHLAVLHPDAAGQVIEEFPDVAKWYIGGHSLGGAMAADYAAAHNDFAGLVLLAAYPTKIIELPTFSIYGSEDGVLNREKYQRAILNARSLTEHIIAGGNHAYFGSYGEQKGDGKASITKEEQWQETADEVMQFILGTGRQ